MDLLTLHSDISRLEMKLDTIICFIESNNETKAKWLNTTEAMTIIGCKKSKLSEMRKNGELEWRHLGNGRNVMISRKSVEAFIKSRSTHLKIA